jgi:sulfatase-like protein
VDPRGPAGRAIALVAALLLLDASVTFENVWPTPAVRWWGALSIELAVCVLAMTVVMQWRRRPLSPAGIAWLSVAWTALMVGRYANVTAPALYGREINLYWDVRYMPDVAGMIARVTPVWLIVACLAGVAVLAWLAYRAVRWAWTIVGRALATQYERWVLLAVAIGIVALFALDRAGRSNTSWVFLGQEYQDDESRLFPAPVTATYTHQVRLLSEALLPSKPLPATPAMDSDLALVRGADVFVVFVESYGAAAYDRPEIATPLAASRAVFASAIHDTNRDVMTAYVESPTYGGSSWLAHVSLLSGIEVREAGTNARLLAERRDTLVRAFGRQGFRTVALMPGLRGPWPEGAFYGFDEIYGADRLAYRGPEFGWFAIPDQFSLHRLDAVEVNRAARPPLFVFFPTISPHFPFSPTPPYQPDWRRMSSPDPYDGPDIVRAYAREPDWEHFAPGYVDSMAYEFALIAGYLRQQATRDVVMVVLGDHQPPALVSGEGASWNVPVHVVAGRRDVLDRLAAAGFQKSVTPSGAAIGRMHTLLPLLLDAFGERRGQLPANHVRSQSSP